MITAYSEKAASAMPNSVILSKIKRTRDCHRAAEVVAVDVDARTVELAFSSEAEVRRWYGIEILSHSPGSCDLSRLNNGGALLDGHDREKQIGVVQRAWIGGDYKGRAIVRFSRGAAGQEMLNDVIDGVRRNVSVGYNVEDVKHVAERDGADVFLVSRWQPYEISIVSIPADTSVGVGRSADPSIAADPARIHISARNEPHMQHNEFHALIAEAMRAAPFAARYTPGIQDPTGYTKAPVIRSTVVNLRAATLPALFDMDGRLRRTPEGAPAATSTTLDTGVIAGSRIASVGARIVIAPDSATPIPVGRTGGIALQSVPGEFRTFESVRLETVATDDDEAPVVPFPLTIAPIEWEQGQLKAIRFEFKRSEWRDKGPEKLTAEILASLVLGLARAADATLLAALASKALTPFTIANAAAAGLKFAELRALIGTAGAGATVGQDGALRAAGIAAEFTADNAGTFVGAWDRAGVAIREDVTVMFERTNRNGDMAVTAWAKMLPLVPSADRFWTVEA